MRRPLLLLLLAASTGAAAGLGWADPVRQGLGHALALMSQGDLAALRDYLRGFGLWAPVVSCALMLLQALLAPLPSFPIMYVNGLLFGTVWGGLLSWASLLVSAVFCFGLGRLFGRPLVERMASPTALTRVDRTFDRFGPYAVFLGRLIPLTAFDLLSYAAGLTPMRLAPFSIATGLGMIPAIFLSAAAGDIGIRSPWALVGGLLAIAGLALLAVTCRPALLRRLSGEGPEVT